MRTSWEGYSLDEYFGILRRAYVAAYGNAYTEKGWHPEDLGNNLTVVNEAVCCALTGAFQHHAKGVSEDGDR